MDSLVEHTNITSPLILEPGDVDYRVKFTRNKTLIHQYKQLRKQLYDIDKRFVGFRYFNELNAENYEDPDDHMLILHDRHQCYGGACLRISTPKHPVMLDLENDILPESGKFYFSLREHLHDMQLNKHAYAEFNRIVLHPSLRKGEATRRIFRTVLERCIKHKVRYMFGIGDRVRIRLYKQIYTNFGMDCQIQENVDIPLREEYEGMKMYLLSGDLKNFYDEPQPSRIQHQTAYTPYQTLGFF